MVEYSAFDVIVLFSYQKRYETANFVEVRTERHSYA
jgi:hypothetical protein